MYILWLANHVSKLPPGLGTGQTGRLGGIYCDVSYKRANKIG